MTSSFVPTDRRKLLLEKMLRQKGIETGNRPAIVRRAGSGLAPLSFGQQRLWFLHQLQPEDRAYNIGEAVRLRGEIDAAALERALTEVARRHEVLRTVYAMVEGEPRQIVQPPVPVPLPRVVLTGLPAAGRESEASRIARTVTMELFDLARGPVLRAVLVELDRDDHVLVLLLHHIATDGWSMGLLVRELTLLYDAWSTGAPLPLPEPPLQYADFAAWQRGWLQGETLDAQLRYWRERLSGAPTRLALPVDRPWPAFQTSRGARTPIAIGAETAAALRELAREQGATLFMVLVSGLAALLARITGEDDILLGTPASGRVRPELEKLIGFFINTLVLRADVTGDPTVPALLSRIREAVLGAHTHQDLPFERLIDALELPRDTSHSPLFQVMLAFQNLPAAEERPGKISVLPFGFSTHRAQFELTFSLADGPSGLLGFLEYRTELFDAGTAVRLVRCLGTLLAGMAHAPASSVLDLPLLSPAEERQLLHEWNETAAAYAWPERGGLHHLIEAQAARTPGAIAASFEGESLTYAELDARANRLARHLRSLGCGPETRAAVAMERSLELLVALLGTLKSGAAYVPLDPESPQERLAYMLDDIRPAVLLTQERLRPLLPETSTPVLVLCSEGRESSDFAGSALDEAVDDLQLAYIIYTSGSTGRPKGAMVHHAAIRNRLLWMQEAYDLGPADTVLQKTPYSFDVSVWEFFWPLLAGARLAFARPGEHRDSAALAARIAAEGATVLHFVPSMLQVFLEEPGLDGCRSLRRVVASGEALTPGLVRRFHERLPGVALENLYGPTEAAVDVTFQPCPPGAEERAVPIGHPIANTRIHLVDWGGRLVPLGVAGELWIAGVNVGRGYLGRPDLTAEKFVPDPFEAPAGGSRAYRTGDLARRRPDGAIEYLGRIDHQVKLRGVRIELGEIESALLRHPGVREAAVVMREDRGVQRLVGYVVPAAAATAEELRRFLLEHLPEAMVPSRIMGLDALPLSPNGKLDRRALPVPDLAAALSETEYAPPASPLEEIVAEVWGEILEVSPVGARDNFFTLGGDSILSLRVVARLRERGFDLTLQQLFQHQTVRDLAREIAAFRGGPAPVRTRPFELLSPEDRDRLPDGLDDAYPLARLQAGMVFHSLFDPEASVYHDIFSERLSGPFDEAVLRRSLAWVMARHPVLRTSFSLHQFQEPLQLVHREAPVPLTVEDLRQIPAERQEREIGAWLEAERHRGFDWAQPPLLRFHIHLLGEDTFQNSLSFHHSILDGWSAAALRTELMRVYMSLLRGEELAEPLADTGFRDFIALERQALESADTREMWRRHLEGSTATHLPRWPRPAVGSPRGHDFFVPVAPEQVDGLKRAARQAGVPLKSVLCAAHLKVTQLVSGQSDVIIGIVANGRPEQEGADQSLGLFLNTLPFRLRLGEESWAELAEAAFVAERDMLPHRRFPLAEIQAAHGGQPLFEIVFGVNQFHVYKETRAIGGLQALSSFGYEETNFPLGVNFSLDADGSHLAVRLNFSDAELAPEQVQAIGSYFAQALAAIATDAKRPHAEAVLLSEAEFRQVVHDVNATERARSAEDLWLHGLFARQAERTPEAPAVIGEDGVIRYGELAGWAGRIAERLLRLGIGAEDRVGVCLERSGAALAALLGALTAGATYVPLDPEWPRERLTAVAADAGLAALLTRSGLAAGVGLTPREVLVEEARYGPPADLPPAPLPSPETAAYVIYTSGSTGMAKGVVISHRAAANFVLALEETLELGPGDRLLLFAPLSFDASVLQIFPTLSRGAAVVVHPDPRELAGAELPGFCERQGLTVLDLPAALWRQWIDDMAKEGRALPAGVRTYLTGGESVPAERVRAWAGITPRPAVFLSSYGPTEATVTATVFLTDNGAAADLPPGKVPIGRPLANVRVYVLDARMRPAPIGVAGELYLAGEGLARGYLGRPELTAAAFLPDAVGNVPGGRLYRTGDLARRLPGGDLEFLGRADTQVKIRGFRLELSEVEAVLGQHPALAECVVTVREDQPGDRRLVAYAVPQPGLQPGTAPGPSELRSFVAERLPQYMVPAAFVLLDALPVLASGKVDRGALPAPESDRPELGSSYAAPGNPTEEALAALWAQVLRLDRVGVHDNFFELGGDSILSIQILARAHQMGMRITARQIFEHPTVAGLARVAASAPLFSAEQGLVTGEVPLTPIQCWFFAEDFATPHHFNQAVVLDILAPLDPAPLELAVTALMRHHDALRMRFPREDGTRRQENAGTEGAAPLIWIDLSALPRDGQAAARVAAQDAVQRSFDLERGPLTRLAVFDGGANGRRLLWVAHHLVIDGVSWRVLVEDLETACRLAAAGREPVLPPKTTSFRAWSERLIGHARSGGFQAELPYWLGVAEGAAARLPVDFPGGRAANTVESSRTVGVRLTAEETQTLLQLVPSTYRTQINDALLAALARAFAAWTGSPALVVDLEAHGREPLFDDVDLSRTVGWFTTHFPVRLDLDDTSDAVDALLAVKEQLRRVPGHGIGHALLVHEGGPEAAPLRTAPPAQVSFNYLGQFDQVAAEATLLRLTGEPAGAARHPRAHRTHLIEVIGLVAGGQLHLDLGYSASLHRRETIERLGASLGAALRDLIARCRLGEEVALTASDFPLLQLNEKSFSKLSAVLDDED